MKNIMFYNLVPPSVVSEKMHSKLIASHRIA